MKIDVTSEDLALINQYTRRELGKDEVYVFSLVLCDNDVDKDFEYFTIESLLELKKLYVGKTGFFCNSRKESNQKARIFDCKFEEVEGKKTTTGINYFRLKAKAYIVKSESNKDIVEKLNQGVINKVTVSCAVRRKVCSICGNEISFCPHQMGEKYEEKLCYAKLVGVSDAYEFNIATDIDTCKECLHYDVCLTFCTENVLKSRILELKQLQSVFSELNLQECFGSVLEDNTKLLIEVKNKVEKISNTVKDDVKEAIEDTVKPIALKKPKQHTRANEKGGSE